MYSEVNVLDQSQSVMRNEVLTFIKQHYDGIGVPIPDFANGEMVKIKPKRFYQRKYVGPGSPTGSLKFFKTVPPNAGTGVTNFVEAKLPTTKMFVCVGFELRSLIGATATENVAELAYVTPSTLELINGEISVEANGKNYIEDEPIRNLFINGGQIDDYYRLPVPFVVQPGESMEVTIELAFNLGATDYLYAEVTAVGFILEK